MNTFNKLVVEQLCTTTEPLELCIGTINRLYFLFVWFSGFQSLCCIVSTEARNKAHMSQASQRQYTQIINNKLQWMTTRHKYSRVMHHWHKLLDSCGSFKMNLSPLVSMCSHYTQYASCEPLPDSCTQNVGINVFVYTPINIHVFSITVITLGLL